MMTAPKTKKKEKNAPLRRPDISKAMSLLSPEGFIKHLIEKIEDTEYKLEVFAMVVSYFVFKQKGKDPLKLTIKDLECIDRTYLKFWGKDACKSGFYEMQVIFDNE